MNAYILFRLPALAERWRSPLPPGSGYGVNALQRFRSLRSDEQRAGRVPVLHESTTLVNDTGSDRFWGEPEPGPEDMWTNACGGWM
ncbi:CheY-like two-component hybrid sensor and regulator [Anopheles sinensis]|uniref:CheY-like two-component hybrid sensor and regulator n=1 Tax=Anopheles sinensis TaxID=74873 RepID=A0A084VE57_ANOSI|nr:CheY-like two-component hybrid sensor and regulator [Anopheles sinensis]